MKFFTLFIVFCLASVSSICAQDFETLATARMQEELIEIGWYPNPVQSGEKISVDVRLNLEAKVKVELIDALGKIASEYSAIYPEGKSRIFIYTQDVKPGLYSIRVSSEQNSFSEKLVIENAR